MLSWPTKQGHKLSPQRKLVLLKHFFSDALAKYICKDEPITFVMFVRLFACMKN
jgi:hypothetical protein